MSAGFQWGGRLEGKSRGRRVLFAAMAEGASDAGQLLQIHSTLRGVFAAGFERVPVPIAAADGNSFVERDGWFWEVAPWLPGNAVLR